MENPDDNVMQEAKETLTQVYERLRHSTDSVLLSQLARQPCTVISCDDFVRSY